MFAFLRRLFGGSPVNYKELVQSGAVIIDVRSVQEYRSGHIQGSRNYPLESLKGRLNELKKLNKPVITVCRSGARSSMARGILKNTGIEAYNGGPWNLLKSRIA